MDEFVRVEAYKEFSERIAAEDTRQNHRIEKLEENMAMIQSLTVSVEKMALALENLTKEVGKQGEELNIIKEQPAKNWERAVWCISTAFITGIIAYILKMIGI